MAMLAADTGLVTEMQTEHVDITTRFTGQSILTSMPVQALDQLIPVHL